MKSTQNSKFAHESEFTKKIFSPTPSPCLSTVPLSGLLPGLNPRRRRGGRAKVFQNTQRNPGIYPAALHLTFSPREGRQLWQVGGTLRQPIYHQHHQHHQQHCCKVVRVKVTFFSPKVKCFVVNYFFYVNKKPGLILEVEGEGGRKLTKGRIYKKKSFSGRGNYFS